SAMARPPSRGEGSARWAWRSVLAGGRRNFMSGEKPANPVSRKMRRQDSRGRKRAARPELILCGLRVLEIGLDRALKCDRHWIAVAVAAAAGRDLYPTFR